MQEGMVSRRTLLVLWAVLTSAVLTVLASLVVERLRIGHDAAMYLHAGTLLVRGKTPYVDFFELNPPLVAYLSAIPAAFARLLHVHPIVAFHLTVLGAAVASTAGFVRIVRRHELLGEAATWIFAAAMAGFSLRLFADNDFGQREHLFVLAWLPFFALRWARWEGKEIGRRGAFALGLACGLPFALKPHFLLMVAPAELWFAASRRRLRPLLAPEMLGVVVVHVVYVAHFAVLPTAARQTFFGRLLPMVAKGYDTYDAPMSYVLGRPPIVPCLVLLVLISLLGRGQRQTDLAPQLGGFTVAALGLYAVQHKGFDNQLAPVVAADCLLVAAVLARLEEWCGERAQRRWLVAASALASALFVVHSASRLVLEHAERRRAGWHDASDSALARVVAQTKPEDSILVVSTSVTPAYPMLTQLQRDPGSRFLWDFPIAMLYRGAAGNPFPYRTWQDAPPAERQFLDDLAVDVASRNPRLVVVDAHLPCQGCPVGFVVSHYLYTSGFVERALSGYKLLGAEAGYLVYQRKKRPK